MCIWNRQHAVYQPWRLDVEDYLAVVGMICSHCMQAEHVKRLSIYFLYMQERLTTGVCYARLAGCPKQAQQKGRKLRLSVRELHLHLQECPRLFFCQALKPSHRDDHSCGSCSTIWNKGLEEVVCLSAEAPRASI